MTKVRDLMTKNVIACRTDTSIQEAARLLYLNGITGMPVLDEQDQVVGIVTESDLIKIEGRLHLPIAVGFLGSIVEIARGESLSQQVRELLANQVKDLMTTKVVTVSPEVDLTDAAEVFLQQKANPVPVVQDKKLVGIISRADLIKVLAGDKKLWTSQWKELAQRL